MKNFWLTIKVPAPDQHTAERMAEGAATLLDGSVVQVDQEPPQGALIVGDHHEDGL